MAEKISEFSSAGTLDGTELMEVVKSGANKQTTVSQIRDSSSGTTTPTMVGVANVDSANGTLAYVRIGNIVIVGGSITVDPTAAGNTQTKVGIPLPIPSTLTALILYGSATSTTISGVSAAVKGFITADGSNDRAQLQFDSTTTSAITLLIQFIYLVD